MPSGAASRVASPALRPALCYLPRPPGSSSAGAARTAQLRSRRSSLGLFPSPPAPSLTTSPSSSHHVQLPDHSPPPYTRNAAVQHSGGDSGPGTRPGADWLEPASPRCAPDAALNPGLGSPALPALNEPLARSIVAPQGSIRQNWTTMWRLPLARGGSRRSDWPGPRPGSPSFYSVRKIRNSERSAECLREGRGRQGRGARGGALRMS